MVLYFIINESPSQRIFHYIFQKRRTANILAILLFSDCLYVPVSSFCLFEFYSSSNFFELALDFFCFSLFNAFLYIARSAVYESLRFFQAEACDFSDDLDNLDLLIADACENNIEFCLFFSCSSFPYFSSAACSRS